MTEPTATPPDPHDPHAQEPEQGPEQEREQQGVPIHVFLAQLTPRAWVTPALASLIVIGFGIEIALGASPVSPTASQLLAAGGDFGPYFLDGQWWRALSAMFLHGGPLHLAFNMWAFLSVGFVTERIFGNRAFLAIYALSGFGASLASLAWNPMVVGVGASGAIFGVYGALLSFVLLHKGVLPTEYLAHQRSSLIGFLGYNVFFALSQKNVDMTAHAGGLVTGMVAGAALTRDLLAPRAHAARRWLGAAGVAGILVLSVFVVRQRISAVPVVRAGRLADSAYAHLQKSEWTEAIDQYTQAITMARPDAAWLANRGLAYLRTDKLDLARKDLQDAQVIESTRATRALLCEVAAHSNGDANALEEAAKTCSAAIALDQKDPDLFGLRARVRQGQGRHAEAIEDATAALALDPDYAFARAVRVGENMVLGEMKAAEEDCAYLMKPKEPRIFDLRICTIVAHKGKDLPAERARVEQWLAKDPTNTLALLERASVNQRDGRYTESIADYDKAIALDPKESSSWNNRAWLKVLTGDFPAAVSDADRAVALAPEDNAYHYGTRCFALVGLGELAKARVDCARAVELRPDGLADRGMLSFIDKKYAAARRDWEAASVEQPAMAAELRPWIAKLPR